MADKDKHYKLTLEGLDKNLSKIVRDNIKVAEELRKKIKDLEGQLARSSRASAKKKDELKKLGSQSDRTARSTLNLRKAFQFLGISLGLLSVKTLVNALAEAQMRMDRIHNSLVAITGSTRAANAEFKFLSDLADSLGVSLPGIAGEYAKLVAATDTLGMSSTEVKGIFTSVLKAARVLGLSMADVNGVLRAIQQMASKGNVQAEELRGQLGERLPGALSLAAEAMGVTTKQLNEMMDRGELLASDLLPRLAVKLEQVYGKQAQVSATTLAAEVSRLSTEWFRFLNTVNEGGVGDAIKDGTKELSGFLKLMSHFASELDKVWKKLNELDVGEALPESKGQGLGIFEQMAEVQKAQSASRELSPTGFPEFNPEYGQKVKEAIEYNKLVAKHRKELGEIKPLQDAINETLERTLRARQRASQKAIEANRSYEKSVDLIHQEFLNTLRVEEARLSVSGNLNSGKKADLLEKEKGSALTTFDAKNPMEGDHETREKIYNKRLEIENSYNTRIAILRIQEEQENIDLIQESGNKALAFVKQFLSLREKEIKASYERGEIPIEDFYESITESIKARHRIEVEEATQSGASIQSIALIKKKQELELQDVTSDRIKEENKLLQQTLELNGKILERELSRLSVARRFIEGNERLSKAQQREALLELYQEEIRLIDKLIAAEEERLRVTQDPGAKEQIRDRIGGLQEKKGGVQVEALQAANPMSDFETMATQYQDFLNGENGFKTIFEGATAALMEFNMQLGTTGDIASRAIGGVLSSSLDSVVDNISEAIVGTQSWGDALKNIGMEIGRSIIRAIVRMVAEYAAAKIAMFALDKIFQISSTAVAAGTAATLTAAWATPALLASIATMGGASVSGLAGYAAALLAGQGLAMATSLVGGAAYDGGIIDGPRRSSGDNRLMSVASGEGFLTQTATATNHPFVGFMNKGGNMYSLLGQAFMQGASSGSQMTPDGGFSDAPTDSGVAVALVDRRRHGKAWLETQGGRQQIIEIVDDEKGFIFGQ